MSGRTTFSETLHGDVLLSFTADEVLHEEATEHHRLELIRNAVFGKVLLLDGAVQVTSADEFMYHEMMAHVPLASHPDPADVLIIGGGDCGLAEEVLKHNRVKSLTQVEIDQSVLDFSRRHFSEFNAPVFEDPRFEVRIADGAAFAAQTEDRFDVAIVDSTDPTGPGAALFAPSFYANLKRILKPGGIAVTQNGVPFLQRDEYLAAFGALATVFRHVQSYLVTVPTYFGGHMTLGWASEDVDPANVDEAVLAKRTKDISTHYYTPAHHRAAFVLPRYIQELLDEAKAR
ncbi:polyamine aminopropyltransferase [Chelativorans sp. Marseille-P2723]|uniref:polyamine aminopropyltransferase n=1 Tax=Chelativorans sp. Marseille-P2723 TaxID=2709133 RepID=UPI00156E6F1A|nr:polyamine aminopropyltransferase [Chelativorans sp. Marseille-P2723]